MDAAEVGEVVRVGLAVPGPWDRVVDVAEVGVAVAAGEPAPFVPQLQVSAQCRWDLVVLAADLDDGVGSRVDEDAVEAGCLCGESPGGLGVDRAVAAEVAGFVALAQQGEDGD